MARSGQVEMGRITASEYSMLKGVSESIASVNSQKGFKIHSKRAKILLRGIQMKRKRIIYPRFLKDIPPWRQRQLGQDLLWFSRFSPVERLQYIDREWEEIQNFIRKFGLKKHGTRKRSQLS